MKMNNQTQTYLLAEITQAWTHYRHLEETRTKYLSFFATVILTSSGFLVTLLKDIDKFDPAQFIASLSIFGFLLFIFSFFIWANISRIGFVLTAYEVITSETRKYMLGAGSTGYNLWNIRTRIPPTVSKGVFRIQSAASAIVLSVCLLLLSAEGYMSYLVLNGAVNAPLWQGYLIAAFAVVIVILGSHGFISLRQAHKYQVPPAELSHFSLYDSVPEVDAQPSVSGSAA
jgi:hypothetical protein